MTIVEFLEARLAEDEAAAGVCVDGPWRARLYDGAWQVVDPDNEVIAIVPEFDVENHHIARHDPARVLREVAAKRAIIERERRLAVQGGFPLGDPAYNEDFYLRALASVYADHPDFDPAWAPG